MNDYIIFSSTALGRKFTDKEWWQYLKEHPDSPSEVVYEYEGFGYNVHDVCIRAKEALKWSADGMYNFRIRVAKCPQGWLVGLNYNIHYSGFSSGPSLKSKHRYESERAAVFAALEHLKGAIEKTMQEVEQRKPKLIMTDEDREALKAPAKINKILRVVTDYMQQFDPRQLTLF